MTSALGKRVVTAALLAAVVVGVLMLLAPAVALPVIACVFLAAAWEWAGFAGETSKIERAVYVVAGSSGKVSGGDLDHPATRPGLFGRRKGPRVGKEKAQASEKHLCDAVPGFRRQILRV